MRTSLTKSAAGSLAAVIVAAGLAFAPASASADPYWGYHHGYWGPAVGLGIAGLAAGAIIASQQPYYAAPVYDDCTRWRPTYDRWGRYIGRRPVNVCD
jgi:hypothetical protein